MAESRIVIYGAIAANVAIAATKFIVAAISGSSAMVSEGIHSTVDTGNGILLLVGSHLSERPPSEDHPFGHGKELFFWSLIVAVLVFALGGGVSIYEGIEHIRHPAPLRDPTWNYIVLGVAALFESSSLAIALRQSAAARAQRGLLEWIRASKDPTAYTVLAEDLAALLGLAFAAAGVYASHRWNMPILDGGASIAIGLLLAGVAVLLIRESRGLLVGEGIRPATARAVREIALRQPSITRVGPALSMYIGRDEVLLTMHAQFAENATAGEIAAAAREIETRIRARFPVIKRIYIATASASPPSSARPPEAGPAAAGAAH